MAISAIINAGIEKTTSIMIEGIQQAATKTSAASSKVAQANYSVSSKVASGAVKGAGMTADMGKGFSAGMNDLGEQFKGLGSIIKEGAKSTFGPMVKDVATAGTVATRGVKKVGGAIGDSKIGQWGKEFTKQGKSVAKMAGVNLNIASLLRQSQLFTGVVGMIFQIIGAFIDILLIPFMPLVTMSMRMLAKLLPPMMKVALFLNSIVQVYADLLESLYTFIFTWAGKLMTEFWKGLNHLGRLIWDEGLKKLWDWLVNRGKEWIAYFKTLPASFKASFIAAKDSIISFFTAIPDAISGILSSVGEFVTGVGTAISGAWTTAKDWFDRNIVQKIKDAIDWTGNFFSNIGTAISDGWTTAKDWFKTNIVDNITGFFTSAGTFFTNIGTTIKDNIVAAWDGVKDFFTSTVPEALKTAFGFVTSKISAIFDFFASVFAPIGNFVQGILNKITGYIVDIIGFLGNAGFGIGQAVRGGMGFDNKEDFNRMIAATRADLSVKEQSSQIELIIKQEQDTAQQAISAANRQANTVMIKQQQSYDLQLADGM
jgi:hypothetical protein